MNISEGRWQDGFQAQCNGCGFIGRACATEDEAVADLDLATNVSHQVVHHDIGPLHLTRAEFVEPEGSDA